MKRIALASIGFLLFSQAAAAAPSWSVISFAASPQNAPQVVAAADALMSSATGKEFPGRLLLQVNVADGNNPATHSFVPIYKTAAERENFVQKLQQDPAWSTFLATMTEATQPVSQVLYRTLRSWGDVVDSDPVWANHAFDVAVPAAFAAALDAFMASPTGKKFPGQVHLSGVVAGGLSPVSHVISVGYASEAEMDAWTESVVRTADWAGYVAAANASAEFLGTTLSRDVKAWGPASLDDLTAR